MKKIFFNICMWTVGFPLVLLSPLIHVFFYYSEEFKRMQRIIEDEWNYNWKGKFK